jgi:hypothetical protein
MTRANMVVAANVASFSWAFSPAECTPIIDARLVNDFGNRERGHYRAAARVKTDLCRTGWRKCLQLGSERQLISWDNFADDVDVSFL